MCRATRRSRRRSFGPQAAPASGLAGTTSAGFSRPGPDRPDRALLTLPAAWAWWRAHGRLLRPRRELVVSGLTTLPSFPCVLVIGLLVTSYYIIHITYLLFSYVHTQRARGKQYKTLNYDLHSRYAYPQKGYAQAQINGGASRHSSRRSRVPPGRGQAGGGRQRKSPPGLQWKSPPWLQRKSPPRLPRQRRRRPGRAAGRPGGSAAQRVREMPPPCFGSLRHMARAPTAPWLPLGSVTVRMWRSAGCAALLRSCLLPLTPLSPLPPPSCVCVGQREDDAC